MSTDRIEDIEDLDALFESVRAQAELEAGSPALPIPAAPTSPAALEAPARSRTESSVQPPTAAAQSDASLCPNAGTQGVCDHCTCGNAKHLRDRVGQITRSLHESLEALSLDRSLADIAAAIPDARSRLQYVTEMCERSAQKVLDTLDELSPLQDATRTDSAGLLRQWDALIERGDRPADGYKALFVQTRAVLAATVERTNQTTSLHTDIMMAQDFQDLTGQVCRKIEAITQKIESELVSLLIESAPEEHRSRHQDMLEGPQVVAGRSDTVNSQSEVDDLLKELGF